MATLSAATRASLQSQLQKQTSIDLDINLAAPEIVLPLRSVPPYTATQAMLVC